MKRIFISALLITTSVLITSAQELTPRQKFLDQTLKKFVKTGH